jgi:ribosome-binding protein aMBF1 (putative translation factor)
MNEDDLSQKLEELTSIVNAQSDLLAVLNEQAVTHTARLETILGVLLQAMIKPEAGKDAKATALADVRKLFDQQLAIARNENSQRIGPSRFRPPTASDSAN